MPVDFAPLGRDGWIRQQTLDVIDLRLAHVTSCRSLIDGHALGAKRLDQRLDRRLATEIHHRACPVEDLQIEASLEAHAVTPVSSKLVISSSPMAKPVDAPAPQ